MFPIEGNSRNRIELAFVMKQLTNFDLSKFESIEYDLTAILTWTNTAKSFRSSVTNLHQSEQLKR